MNNEAGNDRREGQRYAARIKIRFATPEAFQKEYVSNISKGGLFINSRKTHPLRSRVKFLLVLPLSEETVELTGDVVHVVEARPGVDPSKSGIGVQFVDLTAKKREIIEKYLGSLTKTIERPGKEEEGVAERLEEKPAAPDKPEEAEILKEAIRRAARDMQELSPEQLAVLRRKIKIFYAKHAGKNHYDLLGVRYNASPEAIRDAYHKLSMDFHPDRYHGRLPPELGPQVEDIFGRINRAYKTLRETESRLEYDISLGNWAPVEGVPELSEEVKRAFQKQKLYEKQFPEKVESAAEILEEAERAIAAGDSKAAKAKLRLAFSFNPFSRKILSRLNELGIEVKPPADTDT